MVNAKIIPFKRIFETYNFQHFFLYLIFGDRFNMSAWEMIFYFLVKTFPLECGESSYYFLWHEVCIVIFTPDAVWYS